MLYVALIGISLGLESDIFQSLFNIFFLIIFLEMLRVVIVAIFKKKDGAWLIGIGFGSLILGLVFQSLDQLGVPAFLGFLVIVIMSVHLARKVARTNRELETQLVEVEKLSAENLEQERTLREEAEKELQTAHDMQMGLMPSESPRIQGFDISGRCIPASQVGGDFFQYFPISDNRLAISLADVTGHAMEAAVPVMMFSGVLESEIKHGESLVDLFSSLNETLHKTLDKRTFVCFAMGELDTAKKKFRLSNGGCPYPYHFKAASSEIVELQVDGYPLGVRAESSYPVIEAQLDPGDRIVFCSDGIIEAENQSGELFGFERTAETIGKGCSQALSAPPLLDFLINEVKAFSGDTPQGDDQTIVVLQVEA
ncbi:PP2C family protein-serine/threonine phosphatase [Candidatus Bathyarchaeota archaeon]|nr:PP2C family protein-serine/threonine phosphatase [Candidatus Bathyarchaeota archaeon]